MHYRGGASAVVATIDPRMPIRSIACFDSDTPSLIDSHKEYGQVPRHRSPRGLPVTHRKLLAEVEEPQELHKQGKGKKPKQHCDPRHGAYMRKIEPDVRPFQSPDIS